MGLLEVKHRPIRKREVKVLIPESNSGNCKNLTNVTHFGEGCTMDLIPKALLGGVSWWFGG